MDPSTMDDETNRLCTSRMPAAVCSVPTFIMMRVDLIGWTTVYADSRFEYHQFTHLSDCRMKLQSRSGPSELLVYVSFGDLLLFYMRKFSVRKSF